MNLKNGYNNQKDSDLRTLESFKILISNIKYLKDKTVSYLFNFDLIMKFLKTKYKIFNFIY